MRRAIIPNWIRIVALALTILPRVYLAFAEQGLFWPDEFYQSIEQAHRFAFGYGMVPWEWVEGARSWLYPGLIGLTWKMLAFFGVKSAHVLIVFAKLMMVGCAAAGTEGAMRLAKRLGSDRAALYAGVFHACLPALVLFGSKCMTEMVSIPLLLWATYLSLGSRDAPRAGDKKRQAIAGALAAFAIYFRYQNGIVAAGLLAILIFERRRQDALFYGVSAFIVGMLGGVLDWATWGQPFHSFIVYAGFHLHGGASPWGTSPWDYYVIYTYLSTGVAFTIVVAGAAASLSKTYKLMLVLLAYFLVHAAVPHKEYRYITPIVPLFFTFAAVGLDDIASRYLKQKYASVAIASVFALAFSLHAARLTFNRMGHGDGLGRLADGRASVWHAAEGINRLLWIAGAKEDLCGLGVVDIGWTSTGGYAYLHRDVPMLFSERNQISYASGNYLLALDGFNPPANYRVVAADQEFVLFRRPGSCVAPRGYSREMPP